MVDQSNLTKGISLIIVSYCGVKRLEKCLESVMSQTIAANLIEVIIVINGRDDGSIRLIQELTYKLANFEIKMLYTPEKGVANARNLGIAQARREFTVFLDDDDVISPNYLAGLFKYADLESLTLCQLKNISSPTALAEVSSCLHQTSNSVCLNWLFAVVTVMRVMTMNACKIVPTKYLREFKFDVNLKSSEDMVLFSALYISRRLSLKVVPRHEQACYYRLARQDSLSRQTISYDFNIRQRLAVISGILRSIDDRSKLAHPVKFGFFLSRVLGEVMYSVRILVNNINYWLRRCFIRS